VAVAELTIGLWSYGLFGVIYATDLLSLVDQCATSKWFDLGVSSVCVAMHGIQQECCSNVVIFSVDDVDVRGHVFAVSGIGSTCMANVTMLPLSGNCVDFTLGMLGCYTPPCLVVPARKYTPHIVTYHQFPATMRHHHVHLPFPNDILFWRAIGVGRSGTGKCGVHRTRHIVLEAGA
jgi:hypothetical protein